MPPYKKPNKGREERCRNKWSGKRGSHPAKSSNLRSDPNHQHHGVRRERTNVHLVPPLQALKPNVGDHLEGNVGRGCSYIYLLTIWNTAIDQSAAIYKETMAPEKQFTPANGLEINIVYSGTMNPETCVYAAMRQPVQRGGGELRHPRYKISNALSKRRSDAVYSGGSSRNQMTISQTPATQLKACLREY